MSAKEDNTKVAAWGAQADAQSMEPRPGDFHSTHHTRQLSVFYGIDEPSQNSFVYTNPRPKNMRTTTTGSSTTSAATPPTTLRYRLPKRALSSFDNSYLKPRARARARHQPATLPSAYFAPAAVAAAVAAAATSEGSGGVKEGGVGVYDSDGVSNPSRADSLLHRARRVLSLPTTAIRRNPFRTPSAPPSPSPSGSDGTGSGKQRSLPRPNFSRSHTGHISRSRDERILELEEELREQKLKTEAAERRAATLEKQLTLKTEAIPALDTILRKAMEQFEHKEAALTASLARALDARATDKRKFSELVALEGETDRIAVADMSPPTSNSNSNSGSNTSVVTLRS